MAILVEIGYRITAKTLGELFKVPSDTWEECMILCNKEPYDYTKEEMAHWVQSITKEMVRAFFTTEEWLDFFYGAGRIGTVYGMTLEAPVAIQKIIRNHQHVVTKMTVHEDNITADVISMAADGFVPTIVIINIEQIFKDVRDVPRNIQIPDQEIYYTCCGILFGDGNHFVADILNG
jgi:hypothetical protein